MTNNTFHCASCPDKYFIDVVRLDHKCRTCRSSGSLRQCFEFQCQSCRNKESWCFDIGSQRGPINCKSCNSVMAEIGPHNGKVERLKDRKKVVGQSKGSPRKDTFERPKRASHSTSNIPRKPKASKQATSTLKENVSPLPGECHGCGMQIPRARLQALPNTKLCISCAEERPEGQGNRRAVETWGSRDAWKKDRGGWRRNN
jgi:RNA polymerase-binding transcription factor DksA